MYSIVYLSLFVYSVIHSPVSVSIQAFHRNLLAPTYTWITLMWYNSDWWDPSAHPGTTCTMAQIISILNGSIGVAPDGLYIHADTTGTSVSKVVRPRIIMQSLWREVFHLGPRPKFIVKPLTGS